MNSITLEGHVVAKPEIKVVNGKNGETSVTNFRVGCARTFGGQSDFFNVVVWGKVAENCAKYLDKGSHVFIVGELQTRDYEGNDGNKRRVFEIMAQHIKFFGVKKKDEEPEDDDEGYDDEP